mmetsp:Transcript_69710/g.215524  ORF Transcript_69710/g.215524 Transcript_69710/m.215524 type:complete len:624 (-) Transcript_69710:74-1945(-)
MGEQSGNVQPGDSRRCVASEWVSAPVSHPIAQRLWTVEKRLSEYVSCSNDLAAQLFDLHAEVNRVVAELHTRPAEASASLPVRSVQGDTTSAMLDAEAWGRPRRLGTDADVPQHVPGTVLDSQPWHASPRVVRACPQMQDKTEDHSTELGGEVGGPRPPAWGPPPIQEGGDMERRAWGPFMKRRKTFMVQAAATATAMATVGTRPFHSFRRSNGKLFADAEEMKEQIRQHLTSEQTDIAMYYTRTGIWQALARTSAFESISLFMICLNAAWTAIEIDNNDAATIFDSDPVFIVMSNVFCIVFLAELLIRVLAFSDKRNALKEFWIIFDAVLVFLLVGETWVVSAIVAIFGLDQQADAKSHLRAFVAFRILRLLRVLRLARVLRRLPELMVIARAMAIAFRAISVVLMLLGVIIYMGAIVFRVVLEGTAVGHDHFQSVTHSMGTLLLELTLSGARGGPLIREASRESLAYSAMMLLFVLLANVTVMGVLGGLLVQTVKTVAEMEKEEMQVKSMTTTMDELWEIITCETEADGHGRIHEGQLKRLLADARAAKLLQKNAVDLEGLTAVSALICEESDGMLTKPQFKRMVLDLRGKNFAKVKDHVETRRFVSGLLKRAARGSTLKV